MVPFRNHTRQQPSISTNLALRLFKAGESISIKQQEFNTENLITCGRCEIQIVAMEAPHACVNPDTPTFPQIISREKRWPHCPCKLGEKYFVRGSGICFKLFLY